MDQVIGELLPAAIGVALSPVPIIAVVLMLATPRARSNGPAFAAGWVVGLTLVSVVVLLVANGADDPDSSTNDAVNVARIVFGLLFFVLAAKQWKGRPRRGEEAPMPKFLAAIDAFTAGKSFVLGVLLSGVNPKNLALSVAASATIAQAGLSGGQTVTCVVVFVVIASITVAGPVVLYLVAGQKAEKPLAALKTFMAENVAIIMFVLFLILGAKLVGDGFSGLTA